MLYIAARIYSLYAVHRIDNKLFSTHHSDVILALGHQLDSTWRDFGTFLHVEPASMDNINMDNLGVSQCLLKLVEKWFSYQDGTGDLPRTWKTVVHAVKCTGKITLAQQLAEQHGVQLSELKSNNA